MSGLIGEAIAMVSSALVCVIAYVVFGGLINDLLASYVADALASPTGALLVNVNSFVLTQNIILMGFKTFIFFVLFSVLARFFLYVGFKEQEQGLY